MEKRGVSPISNLLLAQRLFPARHGSLCVINALYDVIRLTTEVSLETAVLSLLVVFGLLRHIIIAQCLFFLIEEALLAFKSGGIHHTFDVHAHAYNLASNSTALAVLHAYNQFSAPRTTVG